MTQGPARYPARISCRRRALIPLLGGLICACGTSSQEIDSASSAHNPSSENSGQTTPFPKPPAPDKQRWAVFSPLLDGSASMAVLNLTNLNDLATQSLAEPGREIYGVVFAPGSERLAYRVKEKDASVSRPFDGGVSLAEYSVWLADAKDSFVPRQLTVERNYASIYELAWVGDHSLIAKFASGSDRFYVWLDADTGPTRPRVSVSETSSNVWARDRGAVVARSPCNIEYWARDLVATETLLRPNCNNDDKAQVDWAPDERHFVLHAAGDVQIYEATVTGATRVVLDLPEAPADTAATLVSWTPDSRGLAYVHQREEYIGESLVVVDLDALSVAEHTPPTGVSYARRPTANKVIIDDWANDVVWLGTRDADGEMTYQEVPLNKSPPVGRILSSDNSTLYYNVLEGKEAGVYALDIATGHVVRVTPPIAEGQALEYFDILPNQDWIYYRLTGEMTDRRFLLNLKTGQDTEVNSLPGVAPGKAVSLYRVPDPQLALYHSVRASDGMHLLYSLSLEDLSMGVPILEFSCSRPTHYFSFPEQWLPLVE